MHDLTDQELADGYDAGARAMRAMGNLEDANRFAEAARAIRLGYSREFPRFRGMGSPFEAHLTESQLRAARAYWYGEATKWPAAPGRSVMRRAA